MLADMSAADIGAMVRHPAAGEQYLAGVYICRFRVLDKDSKRLTDGKTRGFGLRDLNLCSEVHGAVGSADKQQAEFL